MVTGQRPFRGDEKSTESAGKTAGERIRYGHLAIPPPDPRLLNPALSQSPAQVILKALAKDSNKRYQNTRELFIETCKAAELNPDALADRVAPPPKPVPMAANEESREIRTTVEWASPTLAQPITRPKRRLVPFIVVGVGILLVSFVMFGIQLSGGCVGHPPVVVSVIFPTNTSTSVAQVSPTFTLSPTLTPLPIPTNTPLGILEESERRRKESHSTGPAGRFPKGGFFGPDRGLQRSSKSIDVKRKFAERVSAGRSFRNGSFGRNLFPSPIGSLSRTAGGHSLTKTIRG